MTREDTAKKVAQALLKIGAVGFVPDSPITFKSGIISPVYVDNRKFPFYPEEWQTIIESFAEVIKNENIRTDVLAGVEAAGIPHSSALGFYTKTPSVFVRKQAKDHGTKKMVEGGNVHLKHVLLIEDLVSTGMSSLAAVESIRKEGGIVEDCLVIVSYEFSTAKEAFKEAKVKLHTLTSFPVILEEAKKLGMLKEADLEKIEKWFYQYSKNPQ
jgi:orotate phosphoribosyltransferase